MRDRHMRYRAEDTFSGVDTFTRTGRSKKSKMEALNVIFPILMGLFGIMGPIVFLGFVKKTRPTSDGS